MRAPAQAALRVELWSVRITVRFMATLECVYSARSTSDPTCVRHRAKDRGCHNNDKQPPTHPPVAVDQPITQGIQRSITLSARTSTSVSLDLSTPGEQPTSLFHWHFISSCKGYAPLVMEMTKQEYPTTYVPPSFDPESAIARDTPRESNLLRSSGPMVETTGPVLTIMSTIFQHSSRSASSAFN